MPMRPLLSRRGGGPSPGCARQPQTCNVDDALAKELVDKLEGATKADIVTGGKGN
jgi:hypothetical protein